MSRVAVHAAVRVDAPAERAWELLTDWARHDEWMPFTHAEGGAEAGAALNAWTGVGPVGFRDPMVITVWRPPSGDRRGRVGVRHTGPVVRGEGRFDVEPSPDGRSRVVWAELLDLPLGPVGRAGWFVVGPAARLVLRMSLRRLARLAR